MNVIIKEIFDHYQVRKTKAQKTAFIEYIKGLSYRMGYSCQIEEKKSNGTRNIVIGNPDTADIVYTAHYDTCARLPFSNFITPKNFLIYFVYQIIISLVIVAIPYILSIALGFIAMLLFPSQIDLIPSLSGLFAYIIIIAFMLLLMVDPANKNTANDNTSGVITLIGIMASLPVEKRDRVAFVFFDLEETGLIGSATFFRKHKKAMKNKLLINFDCVSDGNNILFALKRKARKFAPLFERAYESDPKFKVEVASKGVFYPSDQRHFNLGVGVAALKKSKLMNILYMDKIHTKNDTVFQEENIKFLVLGSIKLAEMADTIRDVSNEK